MLKGLLWRPGENGLGVLKLHRLPCRRRFDDAAKMHDRMYDERGTWRWRRHADMRFLSGMVDSCSADWQVALAVAYYCAVRMGGWLFYRYNRIV